MEKSIDDEVTQEIETLEDFNQQSVEPLNHTRKSLEEDIDVLSVL